MQSLVSLLSRSALYRLLTRFLNKFIKRSANDMTSGSIVRQLLTFAIPMAIGMLFQQLYNTVDTMVVGKFVGSNALAAVGCNGNIINVVVGVFAGLATGAGVVISQAYGSHDDDRLSKAVHTTMALSLVMCVAGTLLGFVLARPLLDLTDTPEVVYNDALTYLLIYFGGLTGLMIYNMGTGILRAVGDSFHPLVFLVISALVNTVLDLIFVIVFDLGVAGVAWATIIAEFLSAILTWRSLVKAKGAYRLKIKKLAIDRPVLKEILRLGLPSAIQSGITSFSNVFVQGYINGFGADCMAGWAAYNKLDGFVVLPIQALSMAATTFVGQCWGADKKKRANEGVSMSVLMSLAISALLTIIVLIFSKGLMGWFIKEEDVGAMEYGLYFVRIVTPFYLCIIFNQIYAGALRGIGIANTPTIIMLGSFVVFRQIYLYACTHLFPGARLVIALAYPVGWVMCSSLLAVCYFRSALFRARKLPETVD